MTLLKSLPYVLIALVLALGIGILVGHHYTSKSDAAAYQTKITAINEAYAKAQQAVTDANNTAIQKMKQDQANSEAQYEKTISDLNGTVASLRADNVVLHDTHRESPTNPPADHTGGVTSSGGDNSAALSPQATDFLLGFAQDADTVRARLIACKADADSIRQAVKQYNEQLSAIHR